MGYIYYIKNTKTEKIYIGKSLRLPEVRVSEHFSKWELMNTDTKLTRAILKYGNKVWTWGVIEECSDDILSDREVYWISVYDSYKNGYNSTLGGDGNLRYSFDKEDIVNKYKIGMSAKEISQEYGCHYHCIHEILQEFGIDTSKKQGKAKPIACFDRYKQLIDVFNNKKEIQEYLIKYGYGNSLSNVSHFISQACINGNLVYKRYWVLINSENVDDINSMSRIGINEHANINRTANDKTYYIAYIEKNIVTFKKFQSLAKMLNNGITSASIQYRLKKAFEDKKTYKGITITLCTEEEYNNTDIKLD